MTPSTSERAPAVRIVPPLVFAVMTLVGVALQLLVRPAHLTASRVLPMSAGVLLVVAGIAIVAAARRWFIKTGQQPAPWTPSTSLIESGPYRFTRNPMYLSLTLIQTGLGFALDNLWICGLALVALTIVHVFAVRPEERYLAHKFGAAYAAYRARVRRYL